MCLFVNQNEKGFFSSIEILILFKITFNFNLGYGELTIENVKYICLVNISFYKLLCKIYT